MINVVDKAGKTSYIRHIIERNNEINLEKKGQQLPWL